MTETALVGLWYDRDQKYSHRKIDGRFLPLSEDEEAAIRWWRKREVDALPLEQQTLALATLSRWTPPVIRGR
jgi:hypothetical protein